MIKGASAIYRSIHAKGENQSEIVTRLRQRRNGRNLGTGSPVSRNAEKGRERRRRSERGANATLYLRFSKGLILMKHVLDVPNLNK